ncbi:TIR domain-containing adapter molecule 1 [Heterodontus francisci]|uniref:TIR domain-containing adapter molecule 1 n=1 Tax=Heterodontus francisci TaxID=7792 RepID=UPI00355C31DD
MAGDCERTPSLDDLFDILSEVPEERLFSLWYKFNPDNLRASKARQLLYSIISFFLKKKDEAERAACLVSNEMPANRCALYILNKIQGSEGGAGGELEACKTSNEEFAAEDSSVLADLARMLAVLVEENLCNPSRRNRACRAAIQALKSNSQEHSMELRELIEEFRLQFGSQDFEDEGENAEVSALKSIEDSSPSMRSTVACRTNPMTIPGQIPTDSLNTSEITIPSHFEISASPTASFTSNSCRHNLNSVANFEENAVNPTNSTSVPLNNYNAVLNLPSDNYLGGGKVTPGTGAQYTKQKDVSSVHPTKGSSGTKVKEVRPIECTGKTSGVLVINSTSKMSEDQGTGNEGQANSISHNPSLGVTKLLTGDQSNSSESTSGKFSPSGGLPEAEEESFENKFYPFVILHASEDVEIAESMRVKLESLVNMEGATFFEEFSLPGLSPIKCIEDAINNSAFTILLLTNNFNSCWEEYKTNIVLMHSINNQHKYNTVIPLLAKKNRLRKDEIPFALSGINSLDENSKHFERHVEKMFTKGVLEKHKKKWLQEQRQNQIQEKTNRAKEDLQNVWKNLSDQSKCMQVCNQLAQMQHIYQFFQLTHPPHQGPIAVNEHTQPVLNPPLYPDFSAFPPGFNPSSLPISPNQPNCNLQPAFHPFMQPPSQVIHPSNSQRGQNVTVSSSTQQQGQGTNIIQIQHAKNVQIGDANQMTITDSIESSESTDDSEDEYTEHN